MSRTQHAPRSRLFLLPACLALTAPALAQTCNPTPCPTQIVRPANQHWYPSPPDPSDFADRRPTAVINLWNASYGTDPAGLGHPWWSGAQWQPSCDDEARDDHSGIDMEPPYLFTGGPNGRPDQFDMLIDNLDNRYERGYRRIMLLLPAGAVACQDYPASQWWPMAEWRRQWFTAYTITAPPPYGTHLGVRGWVDTHPDVEMSVYMGWQIGDPCSICHKSNAALGLCPTMETLLCQGQGWETLWLRCPPGSETHEPATINGDDLCKVWQNIQPWREIGFKRFWLDASSGAASLGATEFREFAYNRNFIDTYQFPVFGGELFPLGPQLPSGRHPPLWGEFDYAPWVILLSTAETSHMNGNPCSADDPLPCGPPPFPDPDAHAWDLINGCPAPPPGSWCVPPPAGTVREGAIWPTAWPNCGPKIHPDWDCPWERLKNTYEWYICKGFTFWQGDLAAQSGIAERIFGFGQIKPGRDFDGDGTWSQVDNKDWEHWLEQWGDWGNTIPPTGTRFTYYHGDMNGDGLVTGADWTLAVEWIEFGLHGEDLYPLPYGPGTLPGPMNWNPNAPNAQWLPCPFGGGSSFGPP